jgi:hypothetical protein
LLPGGITINVPLGKSTSVLGKLRLSAGLATIKFDITILPTAAAAKLEYDT